MSKILLEDEIKQWEDTRCPVCMEHPHNAILLICSSHDKGCRPFMCDTSYRHSNCFDQFCKSFNEPSPSPTLLQTSVDAPTILPSTTDAVPESLEAANSTTAEQQPSNDIPTSVDTKDLSKLICPLCRGSICGWTVVESVRNLMNAKSRSCSCETCDFSGTYKDLRKHARSVHPLVRPTETDPERQRSWRRLERQRDFGDLLSTLQSSFGGDESSDETTLTIDDGGWLTVFFLVRFIRTGSPSTGGRTRAQAARRGRSRLWGESLDGDEDRSRDENGSESSDNGRNGRTANRRNVRRRLNDRVDDEDELI